MQTVNIEMVWKDLKTKLFSKIEAEYRILKTQGSLKWYGPGLRAKIIVHQILFFRQKCDISFCLVCFQAYGQ